MQNLFKDIGKYDIELLLFSAVVILALAHNYEFAETFIAWARELEHLQIDELIAVALYLSLTLPLLVWKRWTREKGTRRELQKALAEVKQLEAFLTMCAHCHRIQDLNQKWVETAVYLKQELDTDFSHSLCPECITELYPDYAAKILADKETTSGQTSASNSNEHAK